MFLCWAASSCDADLWQGRQPASPCDQNAVWSGPRPLVPDPFSSGTVVRLSLGSSILTRVDFMLSTLQPSPALPAGPQVVPLVLVRALLGASQHTLPHKNSRGSGHTKSLQKSLLALKCPTMGGSHSSGTFSVPKYVERKVRVGPGVCQEGPLAPCYKGWPRRHVSAGRRQRA